MWVRTNATGYVRWFARDSGPSREFNTITQYPLVRKNVWTHLCGTFNSSTGITRIYVDGELKTEKVNKRESAIPADFTPAGIGSKFGDDNLIAVDEVYMFAKALGDKEVRALYDDCEFNRMVLHYGFQKINRTAGVVFDQSGLNNNAELRGGRFREVTWGTLFREYGRFTSGSSSIYTTTTMTGKSNRNLHKNSSSIQNTNEYMHKHKDKGHAH